MDCNFVGHRRVGYLGDNYPNHLFDYVGFYCERTQDVVDSVESNPRVAPRECYANYEHRVIAPTMLAHHPRLNPTITRPLERETYHISEHGINKRIRLSVFNA